MAAVSTQRGVLIRPFEIADLPAVQALFAAGMQHYHTYDGSVRRLALCWLFCFFAALTPAPRLLFAPRTAVSEKVEKSWNAYITHAIEDDLDPERGTMVRPLSLPAFLPRARTRELGPPTVVLSPPRPRRTRRDKSICPVAPASTAQSTAAPTRRRWERSSASWAPRRRVRRWWSFGA